MNKVLVALSGGIDSAAVVLMMREQGFQVETLYIDMLGDESAHRRAVELAEKLEVKLHIENVEQSFHRQIVQHTLQEHQSGHTPSPCALCNPLIKWKVLCLVADRLAIDKVATGHYINIVERDEHLFVCKAVDPTKDQSYYLWALEENTLRRAVTPLGAFLKSEVREFLAARGFESLAKSGESMGLCFLQGMSYSEFLAANLNVTSGEVRSATGDRIGEHSGFQLYTIGQKRGFTTSVGGEIRSIDAQSNSLIVGEPLYAVNLILENCVINSLRFDNLSIKVRGLGRNPQGRATVELVDNGLSIHLLDDKAWAPAVGQPVVLYDGDLLIAAGVLASFS